MQRACCRTVERDPYQQLQTCQHIVLPEYNRLYIQLWGLLQPKRPRLRTGEDLHDGSIHGQLIIREKIIVKIELEILNAANELVSPVYPVSYSAVGFTPVRASDFEPLQNEGWRPVEPRVRSVGRLRMIGQKIGEEGPSRKEESTVLAG